MLARRAEAWANHGVPGEGAGGVVVSVAGAIDAKSMGGGRGSVD